MPLTVVLITLPSIIIKDMPFLIVPHPMGMIKKDEIRSKADDVFMDLLKIATDWEPEQTEISGCG